MNAIPKPLSAAEYWKPGELEPVPLCPGCGAAERAEGYRGIEDLLEHVPGSWDIAACAKCGSLHLDPRPTPAAIGKAYESYCTHTDSGAAHARDNGTSLFWAWCNEYLNRRFGSARSPSSALGRIVVPLVWPIRQQLDYYYRHLPRTPGRLLDVGCANGVFLLRARDAGWDVEGVEPDPAAAARALSENLRIHQGGIETYVATQSFDRITLSHVFEHLHQPAAMLTRCLGLLRPGGTLWMAMPNLRAIGHRVYGRAWLALDPPRHLFLPEPDRLKRMLEEAGYVDVAFVRRGRGASYTLRESHRRAVAMGRPAPWTGLWIGLVDVLASILPLGAEELVVTARRPAGASGT